MRLSRTPARPLRFLVVIVMVALAVASVASPAMARSVKKKKHKAPYAVSESVSRGSGTPGLTVAVTGKVSPKAKGRKVSLELRRGAGGWSVVAHETLPRSSKYSMRVRLSSAGSYGLRTVIGKSKKRSAGVSATRSVVVKSPTPPVLHTWRQLEGGDSHTCGIKTDGSLWCWGWNYDGQDGTTTALQSNPGPHTPVRVSTRTDWLQVSAGTDHTCAVAADHSLWCWGSNDFGQLGVSTHFETSTPTPVPQRVTGSWTSVSAGDIETCAVKIGGTAWCWGSDEDGALGDGVDGTDHDAPVQVSGSGTWTSVSAGEDSACGLKTGGILWCWGDNNDGQLASAADNGMNAAHAPGQVGSATWSQVSMGEDFACAVRSDSTAWCWGVNRQGQLGNATNNGTFTANPTPAKVGSADDWSSLSAGGFHTCGRESDGTVSCWGWNFYGEVGNTLNNGGFGSANPTPAVVGDSTMTAVTAGGSHSCGLRGATAFCWGDNDEGELGNATNLHTGNPNPTPLPVS